MNYKNQLSSIMKILQCTDEEFKSFDFILDRVKEFGLANANWPAWGDYLKVRNSDFFGLLQIPAEFARFCMFIAKLNISSAIEIGVFHGASSYFICAILQRINPNMSYTMVDIEDYVEYFDIFKEHLNLNKKIPSTSADFVEQRYDFVFIDADHGYNGVKTDYINVGQYCNIACAFHDIHAYEYCNLDGGVVRFWDELKLNDNYFFYEFSDLLRWMGLGIALKKNKGSVNMTFCNV